MQIELLQKELTPYIQSLIDAKVQGITPAAGSTNAVPFLIDYLRRDGSLSLLGNLAVADGKLIDGVDLSILAQSHFSHLAGDSHFRYAETEGFNNKPAAYANRLNRRINVGPGLVGGGFLTGDIAINVLLHPVSGLNLTHEGLMLNDAVAGNGLTINQKRLSVSVGSGLSILNNAVVHAAGDFGHVHFNYPQKALAETISGQWIFANTLAVNATFNVQQGSLFVNPANNFVGIGTTTPARKLEVTNNFRLSWNALNWTDFQVTSGGTLQIHSVGNLEVDLTGKNIVPARSYETNIGTPQKKFLSLHAAELHVNTLVAQETMATIGGRILVGPTSILERDLLPGQTTMFVKHNLYQANDIVIFEGSGKFEFVRIISFNGEPSAPFSYQVQRNVT